MRIGKSWFTMGQPLKVSVLLIYFCGVAFHYVLFNKATLSDTVKSNVNRNLKFKRGGI